MDGALACNVVRLCSWWKDEAFIIYLQIEIPFKLFSFSFRLYDDGVRKGSVIIQGLEEVQVSDKQEVYRILERGSEKRRTAETKMNANSSRSHTVRFLKGS